MSQPLHEEVRVKDDRLVRLFLTDKHIAFGLPVKGNTYAID